MILNGGLSPYTVTVTLKLEERPQEGKNPVTSIPGPWNMVQRRAHKRDVRPGDESF